MPRTAASRWDCCPCAAVSRKPILGTSFNGPIACSRRGNVTAHEAGPKRMAALQCRCWQCLLLAQLRRHTAVAGIPLMGVKRKCSGRGEGRVLTHCGPWATLRDRLSIQAYSITSSARPSSVTGTSRPSVFAVLGLMNPSAGIRQLPSVALLATFAERCMRYRNRSPAAILPFLSHYSSDYPVRV